VCVVIQKVMTTYTREPKLLIIRRYKDMRWNCSKNVLMAILQKKLCSISLLIINEAVRLRVVEEWAESNKVIPT
jgi:hypothetical protein